MPRPDRRFIRGRRHFRLRRELSVIFSRISPLHSAGAGQAHGKGERPSPRSPARSPRTPCLRRECTVPAGTKKRQGDAPPPSPETGCRARGERRASRPAARYPAQVHARSGHPPCRVGKDRAGHNAPGTADASAQKSRRAANPSRRAAAPALSEELSRNVCPLCGPELQPDQLVFPVAEPNGFGMRNLAAPVGNGVNAGKVIMPGVIALAQHA